MIDIIKETLIDGFKLLPFLFLAFLLIEFLENKASSKTKKIIASNKKAGPLFGGFLGLIPQCGFASTVTNLYVTRIVSLGTLIAVYLSTSDEMLPILISEQADIKIILKILLFKLIIGITCGFIVDFIFRKKQNKNADFDICKEDNCHCEKGIFYSTIVHTIKIFLFILAFSFILNILFEYFAESIDFSFLATNKILGSVILSLIGLIPNCGASVMISELYLNNLISFGGCMAGLLTNSGVALIILFRQNRNIKENLKIVFIIFLIGTIFGILLN